MMDTLAAGLRLADRYRLLQPLGRGGMAAVWEAENEAGQRVAIRMLAAELALVEGHVRRFALEAQAANLIGHDGIVKVIDTGQTPWGAPFLVMERLQGLSLDAFAQQQGQLSPAVATAVLVPALDALAAAHAAGVLHRDLKPANLFLCAAPRRAVKLLDFGISKIVSSAPSLTQTGVAFGTPAYMSPEQMRDVKSAGPLTDLYAMGAVAYELLAGRPVYEGDTALGVAAKVLSEAAMPLREVRPELPAELCRLIDRSLAREPSLRPASAIAFRDALAALVPPDAAGLFALVEAQQAAKPVAAPAREKATVQASPRAPALLELSAAHLLEKLAAQRRSLAPELAGRIVYDLLLDPATPQVLSLAHLFIASDGRVRASPGAPLSSTRGARVRSLAAPELAKGRPANASVQFTLGAVLYELIQGTALFEAADARALATLQATGTVPPFGPRTPPALLSVVQRMVAPDPLARYPDSGSCAGELMACFKGQSGWSRAASELGVLVRNLSLQRPLPVAEATTPPARGVSAGSAIVAVILAVAVGAGVAVWRIQQKLSEAGLDPDAPQEAPTPPPREVALAPLPQGSATYAIRSTPDFAALWLDGTFRGNAPGDLTLELGKSWELEARLPGHRTTRLTLTPTEPGQQALPITLEPTGEPLAVLRFDGSAQLLLDGESVGHGPLRLPVVAGHPYQVELDLPSGRSSKGVLTFSEGEVHTLSP